MKYINMIVAFLMGISFALAVSHTPQGSLRQWPRPTIKSNSKAQAPFVAKDTNQGPEGNYTLTDIKWEVPIGGDEEAIKDEKAVYDDFPDGGLRAWTVVAGVRAPCLDRGEQR